MPNIKNYAEFMQKALGEAHLYFAVLEKDEFVEAFGRLIEEFKQVDSRAYIFGERLAGRTLDEIGKAQAKGRERENIRIKEKRALKALVGYVRENARDYYAPLLSECRSRIGRGNASPLECFLVEQISALEKIIHGRELRENELEMRLVRLQIELRAGVAPEEERLKRLYELYKTPIEELGIPARAYHSLRRGRMQNVGELVERTEEELLEIRKMGALTVSYINTALSYLGLSLKGSRLEPFPPEEEFYQKDVEMIVSRNCARTLGRMGIAKVGDLAGKEQLIRGYRLYRLADTKREALAAIRFYGL